MVQIAPAPDGPASGLLLARHTGDQPDLMRTRDGGATWERLTAPSNGMDALVFAPASDAPAPVFGIARDTLYRSTDAGSSWSEVLAIPSSEPISIPSSELIDLTISPDFARDGLAHAVAAGRLFRGRDRGASWEEVVPSPSQRVEQARFSPDFAHDRTVLVASTSGGFASTGSELSTDHEQSLGVLISTDGGDSWAQSSAGLEVDSVPYRHVQHLAVSPTFVDDGTLFAFAWGPSEPGSSVRGRLWTGALFRSQDRGASWVRVSNPVRLHSREATRVFVEITFSPSFATDGIALLRQLSYGITPGASVNALFRTADRGESWAEVLTVASLGSVTRVKLLAADGQLTGIARTRGSPADWQRSADGGLSWQPLAPPGDESWAVEPSPAFAEDRTLLVGSKSGGLWAFDVGAR